MGFDVLPKAEFSDADIADALGRAVRLINPVLTVLSEADPFGLKDRTYRLGQGEGAVGKALDTLACALNTTHAPGTRSWERLDERGRVNWWVRRVGAVNTVFVAFPGVFGVLASRLPVQDLLGFANQAIVLCAVAREHGVTDYQEQIRLLAKVLCGRELSPEALSGVDEAAVEEPSPKGPFALARTLWRIAGIIRAIGDELEKRPQPKPIYRRLGVLPGIGGLMGYLGEIGALRRAVKAEEQGMATPESSQGAARLA